MRQHELSPERGDLAPSVGGMGTAAGALGKLERAVAKTRKLEAQLAEARAAQEAVLREALAFPENTYAVVNARTGLARATISKAATRGR